MVESNLSRTSSPSQKKDATKVIYDQLLESFFDRTVFINLAYSDLGGGGTTSGNFGKLSRIIDTAEGKLMAPGRDSRMRCQFYLKNPSKMEGYILSPAVYDSQTLPGSLTTMAVFRSYVGIKFSGNAVYVAVKEANANEVVYPLELTLAMFDATYTDTYALEIRHNTLSTDIIINNTLYGTYSSDMVESYSTVETFYPFFSPARSTDGTSVNIVSENIQFIQSRY